MPGKVIDIGNGQKITLPQIPWYLVIGVVVLLFVIIAVTTSYYTIDTNAEGVVTRFGRYSQTVQPGLHFKLPFGIDRVYPVPTRYTRKDEFGFRTQAAGRRTTYSSRQYMNEKLMVTGDLNMAQVEWIVQYKVKDARDFQFNMRSPVETLRDISESIMREVVGDFTVTEVLTEKREEINSRVKVEMQNTLDSYKAGILVKQVILQDVNPPENVKAAFDEVNNAQQEKEKTVNEARQAYNKAIPLARGDALKTIQEAEGYALDRVNRAQGEVARFNAIYQEYIKAPDVTRRRLYLEAMREILPTLDRRVILDPGAGRVLPLLDLGKDRR